MKKILLLEIKQRDKSFYTGVLNPREVIKLIDIPPKDRNQDANRPWKEKRVQEISKYVAGNMNISDKKDQARMAKGYIANCPILSLSNVFEIKKENGLSYLYFPESEEEFNEYKGNMTVLDGQHRLIAFSDEYIDPTFSNFDSYNMGFVLFNDLTTSEMREIFMVTNDKQEKVESNVLKLMKRWLGLLSAQEDSIYRLAEKLNEETISPLRGKIIIGGNKIAGGFKAAQIIKILDKSGVYDKIMGYSEEQQIKFICVYLNAWKEVYSGEFLNVKYFLGKTTGIRYICFLFTVILDILENQKNKYEKENIKNILSKLYKITILNAEAHDALKLAVRSESGTIAVARQHGEILKDMLFNNRERFKVFDV